MYNRFLEKMRQRPSKMDIRSLLNINGPGPTLKTLDLGQVQDLEIWA